MSTISTKSDTNGDLSKKEATVALVVLGDIGHSPRMSYHALSLAKEGFKVILVGLPGSQPQAQILHNPNISIVHMWPFPKIFNYLPRILSLGVKVWWQAVIMFLALLFGPRISQILVQNPPGVPTLPVTWLYSKMFGTRLLVDWHNYGFSIMALSQGRGHVIVRLYRMLEMWFGHLSSGGFSVTEAMREDLGKTYGVKNLTVLYDKPHSRFQPLSDEEKHEFYLKMAENYPYFTSSSPDNTIFSQRYADGRVVLSEDRPAILVSSTSWTEDEDFSILLHALCDYERVKTKFPEHYPPMLVVITGKGPLRDEYINRIKRMNMQHIVVLTPWLTAEDYPKLLASADMGTYNIKFRVKFLKPEKFYHFSFFCSGYYLSFNFGVVSFPSESCSLNVDVFYYSNDTLYQIHGG